MPNPRFRYYGEADDYSNTFMEWAAINGFQAYFQPSTVQLPPGITTNQYGWLDSPTANEIVIPLVSVAPTEQRILYWFYEKIVSNSDQPLRISLEGNFNWNDDLGDFDPNSWVTTTGYTVSNQKDHVFSGLAPIKTIPGEALRLRVYPSAGNNNDFYFKFIAMQIPV